MTMPLAVPVTVERLTDLYDDTGTVSKDLLKNEVVADMRKNEFIGIPDTALEVNLEPADDSDILIRKIDPEKALGFNVFSDEASYFSHLQADLYVPQERDFE